MILTLCKANTKTKNYFINVDSKRRFRESLTNQQRKLLQKQKLFYPYRAEDDFNLR